MDKLQPIYCQRCNAPAAWTTLQLCGHVEALHAQSVICNLCVLDEHTVLRWLKRVINLFPGSISMQDKQNARAQLSNNVTFNINNFNVLKHDDSYKLEKTA